MFKRKKTLTSSFFFFYDIHHIAFSVIRNLVFHDLWFSLSFISLWWPLMKKIKGQVLTNGKKEWTSWGLGPLLKFILDEVSQKEFIYLSGLTRLGQHAQYAIIDGRLLVSIKTSKILALKCAGWLKGIRVVHQPWLMSLQWFAWVIVNLWSLWQAICRGGVFDEPALIADHVNDIFARGLRKLIPDSVCWFILVFEHRLECS